MNIPTSLPVIFLTLYPLKNLKNVRLLLKTDQQKGANLKIKVKQNKTHKNEM